VRPRWKCQPVSAAERCAVERQLVVNLNAADTSGLEFPPNFLALADYVIE
jgi:hypothetical protein